MAKQGEMIDCPGCGTYLSSMLPECPSCKEPLQLTFKRTSKKASKNFIAHRKIPWVPVAVVIGFAYLWASPYLTLWNLKSAMEEKDSHTIVTAIDFARVKDDLKEKMNAHMAESMSTDTSGLEMVGGFLASGLADKAIDVMVTKTNLKKLIANGDGDGKLKGEVSTDYISWNHFNVTLGPQASTINLERNGLASWKIVGFEGELAGASGLPDIGTGDVEKSYEIDMRVELDNFYLPCRAFFLDNGGQAPCTVQAVSGNEYGFRPSNNVFLEVLDGSRANFRVRASHAKSKRSFTINASGDIS